MESLYALLTLTAMETVLGIDNIIFIAIIVSRLPMAMANRARNIGIVLALVIRIGLLFSLSWLMSLTEPFFQIAQFSGSGRNIILLLGGLFLVAKSTSEIHSKMEDGDSTHMPNAKGRGMTATIAQILVIDIVFSLDSVITAVGMVNSIPTMVAAMVISMIIMLMVAGKISSFVENNPTIKILALAFLILIGVMLVAESMGAHVPKGYIYFAMAFSFGVELLNMRYRTKARTKKKVKSM